MTLTYNLLSFLALFSFLTFNASTALAQASLSKDVLSQTSAPSPSPNALNALSGSLMQTPEQNNASTSRLPLSPQTKKTTIKQLQDEAIQRHPVYKIADNSMDAERGVRTQAGLRSNPTLHYESEEIGAEGKAGIHGFSIEQEFGTNKRRKLLVQLSDRTLETLDWNKQIVIAKIQNDVRSLAYQLLIAQKKVEFHRQLVSILQAAEDNAHTAILAGSVEITQLNFIQLQNQTRQAKLMLTKELNTQEALEKKLALLVGTPNEPIGKITDDPEDLGIVEQLSENEILEAMLEHSPEIAKKKAEILQKQAALTFERSPQKEFTIEGGASYDFGDSTTLAHVGVGIPLRINDRNEGNIQRATAEYFAAQRELERMRLKLRADFAEIFAVYKTARAEVQAYQTEILPDLKRFFAMSQQAYQQAQINFLEISAARASYIESSVNYLEALERLADSIVKIEGALLDKSLESEE